MKEVLWAKTERGKDAQGNEGPPTLILFKRGVAIASRVGPVEAEERHIVIIGVECPPQLEGKAVEAEVHSMSSGDTYGFSVAMKATDEKPDEPDISKLREKMTPESRREKGAEFGKKIGMGMRGGKVVGNVKKPKSTMPPGAGASKVQAGSGMRGHRSRTQRGGANQGMRGKMRTRPRKKVTNTEGQDNG